MRRVVIAALLSAGLVCGQSPKLDDGAPVAAGDSQITVYLSAHGKTYHTHRDCGSLGRSKTVLTASEHDAQVHGLTLCGICAHRHHTAAGSTNGNWAKPEAKQ